MKVHFSFAYSLYPQQSYSIFLTIFAYYPLCSMMDTVIYVTLYHYIICLHYTYYMKSMTFQ